MNETIKIVGIALLLIVALGCVVYYGTEDIREINKCDDVSNDLCEITECKYNKIINGSNNVDNNIRQHIETTQLLCIRTSE